MLSWSINLFKIRGIQLVLHGSFLLILAYWAIQGYQYGGTPGLAWSVGQGLTLFVCVLLHELGHSITGQHFGLKVSRIMLWPLGGIAQFESIPRKPSQEILMTLAGPAVNFVIAGLLWLVLPFPSGWDAFPYPSSLADLGRWLVEANLWMGCFNLLPVFPSDGGRLLRATLATRLSYLRATFVAATVAKIVAVGGFAIVCLIFYFNPGGGYWNLVYFAALMIFIIRAGEREYQYVKQRGAQEAYLRQLIAQAAVHQAPPPGEPPVLHP
jgi:Zn-dependent protease